MLKKILRWFLKNPEKFEEKEEREDTALMENTNEGIVSTEADSEKIEDNDLGEDTANTLDSIYDTKENCGNQYPFRLLCLSKETRKIDSYKPADGLFMPYSVYETITNFFENHGITDYNIRIDNPVFATENELKNQIKHKDKHGIFDVMTKLTMYDEEPEINFDIRTSMAVPVFPFKDEEAEYNNWFVANLLTSIVVSYAPNTNTGKLIDVEELTEFFAGIGKAIIKTASESSVAKDIGYKLPNVLPEKLSDLPNNSKEREITIYSRFTAVDEKVGKMINN